MSLAGSMPCAPRTRLAKMNGGVPIPGTPMRLPFKSVIERIGPRSLAWTRFFFQAEDGIRDLTVTGVQTCALPISMRADANQHAWWCEFTLFGAGKNCLCVWSMESFGRLVAYGCLGQRGLGCGGWGREKGGEGKRGDLGGGRIIKKKKKKKMREE